MSAHPAGLSLNIFVDALGYGVAEEFALFPELAAVRQPVRTVLGYSSGAVPTILTGVLPKVHGQWSFFYWDPDGSPFRWLRPLRALPHRVAANHRIRNPLSKLVARVLGYTGYFNLYAAPFDRLAQWNYCEKRDIFDPAGLNGAPTIFGAWRNAGLRWHCSDWRIPEAHNLKAAEEAVADPALDAAFVYLPGLDAALHRVGRRGASGVVKPYTVAVQRVVRAAQRVHPHVRVSVFSDHGMADVRRNVDLQAVVERLGLRYGHDYAAIYDSTMVRLYFLRPSAEAPLREVLLESGCGRFMTDSELRDSGLDFPDRRYGHAIFLCEPGVLIVPSDMGLGSIAGMHGYSEDDPDSHAVLLSNQPLPCSVRRIDDLNYLMRAHFGLPPAPLSLAEAALVEGGVA